MITLVTGGGRSGKSTYAEELVARKVRGGAAVYIATATATDEEISERIRRHRERRPENWRTLERWKDMARVELAEEKAVLLDCVGFMLDNTMFEVLSDWDDPSQAEADEAEGRVKAELTALAAKCRESGAELVMVTNEVGSGIVPATKLSRLYRDALGRVNCHAAALSDRVYLLVCGIPVEIK